MKMYSRLSDLRWGSEVGVRGVGEWCIPSNPMGPLSDA